MNDLDQNAAAPGDRPRRGWWSRNWLWFVPVMLLLLVLLCGGLCGGILLIPFGAMKSSEPYQAALTQVQNNPQVIEMLGQPIEETGWFPSGEFNIHNSSGDARFDFDVMGPKGKAHVHTEARRTNSRWGLTVLDVTTEDGQKFSCYLGDASALDEAPPFQP